MANLPDETIQKIQAVIKAYEDLGRAIGQLKSPQACGHFKRNALSVRQADALVEEIIRERRKKI